MTTKAEMRWRAAYPERWEAEKRQLATDRADARRHARDERQEIVAWSKRCLIEAYEDMRGHPSLPVVRDV